MDTGYLTTQVSTIVGQLHGLFDEIGVPKNERESRESEVSEPFQVDVDVCSNPRFSYLLPCPRLFTISYDSSQREFARFHREAVFATNCLQREE